MCGIAGIWERGGAPVDEEALGLMGDMVAHRGPDGGGTHVDGGLGLVNRRLRILDLREAADQPMGLGERGLWLTFNGEIHNYVELRRELERAGARLHTRTDTEVVLWAYAHWGPACFERFNGMWAMALWDARSRQLVLCRDRFGIKPLCFSVVGPRVCFASEPKAILAAFAHERIPNGPELAHFAKGGFPDAGAATAFKNVRNVAPATFMVFSAHEIRTECYWSFVPGRESAHPLHVGQFRELMADAVTLRTRSDAPWGTALSGGLDSSTIVGLLAEAGHEPVHCFSTVYDEPAYDESRYATLMAKRHGLTMHWVRPDPSDLLATMRDIVWHHDAPTPIRGRLANWFVAREARQHVKVLIEGHGSDELLAGYARDVIPYLIDRVHGPTRNSNLPREIAELGRVGSALHWFLLTGVAAYLRDPRRDGEQPYKSRLNNMLWNGFRRDGLPECLHGSDAIGMAHSVETRVPFLDHRIVELCFSLAYDEKIAGGWTKSLLRRAMADLLPREILARRTKFGFAAPVAPWLRIQENARATRHLLLDPRAVDRSPLPRRRLEAELKAFYAGSDRYARMRAPALWRWITLELWFREFIDGEGFHRAVAARQRFRLAKPSPASARG